MITASIATAAIRFLTENFGLIVSMVDIFLPATQLPPRFRPIAIVGSFQSIHVATFGKRPSRSTIRTIFLAASC
jgi:hypothetical protein